MQRQPYSGVENLEVMREAVNYNNYLLRTVREHAKPGDRILDFGAGSGQFAVPLSRAGLDITALEPDEFLRGRIAASGIRAIAEINELPNGTFDYIYTLNVLEHIQDDVNALRSIYAKLKPQGTLLIYVPAFPMLYSSMDAKVGHIRRYTRSVLVQSVRAVGLETQKVAYVDSLGFLASLAFKAMGSETGNVSLRALKIYDRMLFPLSRLADFFSARWLGKNLLLVARKH